MSDAPSAKARKVADEIMAKGIPEWDEPDYARFRPGHLERIERAIARAIDAARREENEACAKIAEATPVYLGEELRARRDIAASIRSRSLPSRHRQ